ncbi:hypothetical protein B296_00001831 [Ensete ventricosum]|uniref:Uncharacterized protein n=1 Tax=Ensete ventricosum TaxID=4639 RepID=A0A427AJ61_ENSVE|nr:hypothetical protein B296_00001831 [Ensete ventricosum]
MAAGQRGEESVAAESDYGSCDRERCGVAGQRRGNGGRRWLAEMRLRGCIEEGVETWLSAGNGGRKMRKRRQWPAAGGSAGGWRQMKRRGGIEVAGSSPPLGKMMLPASIFSSIFLLMMATVKMVRLQ